MKTLGLRDIIGPVMVGPSSSHTAGALAIAKMARNLCAQPPARVTFTLYGSFAHTGSGHGTDKALVAGMLGFDACDLEIRDSFSIARDRGLDVEFVRETRRDADHPNTVDIVMEEPDATRLEVRGVSVGGGAAVITRIDGIDVDVTGEHTSVVIRQRDERGALAHIASCIAERGVNIATTRMYRTRRGATAYTVMETDDAIPPQVRSLIAEHESILDVRVIPAMNRIAASAPALDEASAEERFDAFDFTSGAELIALCAAEKCSIAHAYRMREEALCALDGRGAGIDEYLDRVLSIMEASATEPADAPLRSTGGLIGGEAKALRDAAGDDGSSSLLDALSSDAVAFALAVLETNAAMGRIVAAPTAGSAGVVPAVLLALAKHRDIPRDTLREGLLTAAAVGHLIARNASVSGAEGGCQAEVGSAAGMAAAAAVAMTGGTASQALDAASNALTCLMGLVQAEVGSAAGMAAAAAVAMTGGTASQALDAASNALTCLMGLVCDPVGGLVEIPCQKRNATAALTALASAQIALAGVANLVGFDETVAAMDAVGRTLPFELRESALGGIAATPSACAWCAGRG